MIIIIRESFNDSVNEVQHVKNVFNLCKNRSVNYNDMENGVLRSARREMTRDECRKCLRYLELDAYGNMVSVLRAQGPLTANKQKLLQEFAKILHISNERHRAEVRRAVNDEKLAMIAEQLNGPNTTIDWTMEGRRTIPLLPRLKARNAFTMLANSLSLATAHANDNYPIQESKEEEKDILDESKICFKFEKKSLIESSCNALATVNHRKRSIHDVNKVLNIDKEQEKRPIKIKHQDVQQVNSTKQELTPSFSPPHNKVLVLSSNSMETSNHSNENETSLEAKIMQSDTTTMPQQNVTIIPLSTTCAASSLIAPTKDILSESTNTLVSVQPNANINAKISICASDTNKNTDKITVQNKLNNPRLSVSTGTLDSVSHVRNSDTQSENQDLHCYGNEVQTVKPEIISTNSSVKNVLSTIQSSMKPVSTVKSAISTYTRVTAPGTIVSSGPGPPSVKSVVTTLACKKLPVAIFNQPTAKMGVALNSDKTVNIINHPNKKLTSKTNVIVIQKGHNKGIMLSHAGKEVLGKVILGGKKLPVGNQQNSSTVNILPHHINLDNGNQTTTMLTATHMESVKTSIKEGDNKEVHLKNTGSSLNTNNLITTLEETVYRKSKDPCQKIHSQILTTAEPVKFKRIEETRTNSNQFADTQDNSPNNTHREDSICSMEINTSMFENGFQSADFNFKHLECLVENGDHISEDKKNPVSITYKTNLNDS